MTTALRAAIARAHDAEGPREQFYSPLRALGRRRLSLLDLIGQSLSTIAPATGMVFIAMWMSTHDPGIGGVLVIALTTAVVGLVAWCISQFTRRLAAAGSLYSFVSQGLGARAALVTGAALLVGYLGISISVSSQAAHSLLDIAGLLGLQFGPAAWPLVILVLAVTVGAITVRGVRFATRAILAAEISSLALIVTIMVATPADTGAGAAGTPATPVGLLPFLAMLTVLSMAGFESGAFFGPETTRPLTTVTRTVLVSPAVVGALFVFAAVAALLGHGTVIVGAYFDGTASGASWGVVLAVKVGMACSWFASTMGCAQAGSRLLFSMGVERVVPVAMSRVHRRFRTPHTAVALFTAVSAAGAAVYALCADGDSATFGAVVELGLVTAYSLVALASLLFLRRIGEDTVATRAAAIFVTALGTGLLAFLAVDGILHGAWLVPAALAVVGSSGAVWHAALRRAHPDRLTAVGVFDSVETDDLLPGAGTLVEGADGRRHIVATTGHDVRQARDGDR
ncbi:APC family permease [Rhodococcus sp. SGAir0479]|uniref:APC family permease n=1 Tax=Rhodococcus sp. SGAir0479 TaxID=2567884 RepID=UPI0010CCEC27|nr:APC family permease [Rhodococcus sp. SGAir0479]QCQ92898.1 APC family permease [Rhodococcus sp. SGAir0479]